ncbi:clostripain family protease [Microcoleus sp. FACHB-672]|nr:clostripain family protease [Microcoleus sp. FACHB-672]
MKRRSFCRYIAMGSACFAGVAGRDLTFAMSANSSQTKSHHKWVVLYWMPYDNNLSSFGEPIVEMLSHGTQNSEVVVVVQSDYWGAPKMRRRLLVKGAINEIDIEGEDSSDASAFSAYLAWANQTFEAEHWAVIIVGHGGRINEVSPDDHRATTQTQTWMRVDEFANAVSSFNQSTNGRVELLFFQNCNKATLEVVYEARNCARYTLASQLNLGAPNYYYEGFFYCLKKLSIDGREVAIAIMDSERADMYHTLTLVDNQVVKYLPEKLSRVVQQILDKPIPDVKLSELSTYPYFDEQHCDALVLLDYLSRSNNQAQKELTEFSEFLRSSVITHYKTGGKLYRRLSKNSKIKEFCGLSLYLPETEQTISRYSSLALSQRVDLVSLYRRMLSS